MDRYIISLAFQPNTKLHYQLHFSHRSLITMPILQIVCITNQFNHLIDDIVQLMSACFSGDNNIILLVEWQSMLADALAISDLGRQY